MDAKQWHRIWDKVEKTTKCWLWTGGTNGHYAHARSRVLKKDFLVHRLVYETCVGPIPIGMVIDHLCKNTLCVNPLHLRAVSQRVNLMNSDSPSAICSRRSKCAAGHSYTAKNTYRGNGWRQCRKCHALREAKRRARAEA